MKYPTAQQYIHLTNKGAHFATQVDEESSECSAIRTLLRCAKTPKLTEFLLLLKSHGNYATLEMTMDLINKKLIIAKENPDTINPAVFEANVKAILPALSDSGHCAICDNEGFVLAYTGFELAQAEQASLLAIEISSLQAKREHNIQNLSGNKQSFISIIDSDGHSELRFWPMQFNTHIFYLAIKDTPQLEHSSFTRLTWLLGQRYL
jgi:hypothetical protein